MDLIGAKSDRFYLATAGVDVAITELGKAPEFVLDHMLLDQVFHLSPEVVWTLVADYYDTVYACSVIPACVGISVSRVADGPT